MTAPTAPPHPAKYTAALLPVFAALLDGCTNVLDPMAGVGGIHRLRALLPELHTVGVELEPEWAAQHPETRQGDALALPFDAGSFDAVCVSPCYGNRMADHHEAKDASRRHTYRHSLGRPLHSHNAGALQWGEEYRRFHVAAWTEARRVLRPGGLFLLNCKDFVRAGAWVHVTQWHVDTLTELGFCVAERRRVACPGQRHGANGALRADSEDVVLLRRGEPSA